MAILVEGISVIVRCSSIVGSYVGGTKAFVEDVPNHSLCADGELACVAFMTPADAETYVKFLESRGLKYREHGSAVDIVVVDQRAGFCFPCTWAEFGITDWNNDPGCPISVCAAVARTSEKVVVPNGWTFANSMSAEYKFIDGNTLPDSLKFVRHEEEVDVYVDVQTGKEFFTPARKIV